MSKRIKTKIKTKKQKVSEKEHEDLEVITSKTWVESQRRKDWLEIQRKKIRRKQMLERLEKYEKELQNDPTN